MVEEQSRRECEMEMEMEAAEYNRKGGVINRRVKVLIFVS